METYKNLGRGSGVTGYFISEDSIKVLFNNGGLYLYNYSKPGRTYVERMKILAISGQGLNSLINREIGGNCFKLS